MYAAVCDPAGAGIFIPVGEHEESPAVESGEVHARVVVHWCGLSAADTGVDVDGLRKDQSAVACWSVLFGSLRRDVFESGWLEHDQQIGARAHGRFES